MKYLLFFVLTALIGGGLVIYFTLNKSQPDFESLEADFTLSAQDLYNDFVENTENASTKYNGKMLLISGEVTEVEKVDSLTIAVFVFGEGMFGNEGIRCTFLDLNSKIKLPAELMGFQIKGYCSGYNDTDVILEKCTLFKN